MTDLRTAVVWLSTLAVPWSSADLAALSGVDQWQAKAYATCLARDGVLAVVTAGGEGVHSTFRAGRLAAEWRAKKPKTRPGGGARVYRAAQAVRDRLRAEEWQAKRAGATYAPLPRLLTSPEGADGSRLQQEDAMQRARQHPGPTDPCLTPEDVAGRLNVHRDTVERAISSGQLRAMRLSPRALRISEEWLQEYIAAKTTQAVKA